MKQAAEDAGFICEELLYDPVGAILTQLEKNKGDKDDDGEEKQIMVVDFGASGLIVDVISV